MQNLQGRFTITQTNIPLTSAQKQARRVTELDAIAHAAGWYNIGTALTALKRNVIKLPRKPDDYDDRPAQRKQAAASRANGKRGGRPKKEQARQETRRDLRFRTPKRFYAEKRHLNQLMLF